MVDQKEKKKDKEGFSWVDFPSKLENKKIYRLVQNGRR